MKWRLHFLMALLLTLLVWLALSHGPAPAFVKPSAHKTTAPDKQETPTSQQSPPMQSEDPEDTRRRECWARIKEQMRETNYPNHLDTFMRDLVEPWYYRKDETLNRFPRETAPNLFYAGLAKTGLLEGRTLEADEEQGLAWLKKAAQLDPANSAPLLFAALVESRRGHKDESEELLQQAAHTSTRFNSYLLDIHAAAFAQVQTTADYAAAFEMFSQIPVANYMGLKDILKDNPNLEFFASQLMEDGADPRKKQQDFDYVSIEYGVGRSLIKDTALAGQYPTLKELWAQKEQSFDPTNELELEKRCDLSALEPNLQALRARRRSQISP